MSGDRFMLTTDDRGIATLTLNRPEVANGYDADLLHAMTAALEMIAKDATVEIRKAKTKLRLAAMPDVSFFSVVRQKLKWSGSNV